MSDPTASSCRGQAAVEISVVIPTWNEAGELRETVQHARLNPELGEIIVVDGGSQDETVALATTLGCRVLNGPRGRGRQLGLGAKSARGAIVLFLHADTWLPANAGQAILTSLRDPKVVGGGLWKVFRGGSWLLRGSRLRCAIRFWVGGLLLGDQALFVRREVLERIGGMPELPLMEEFELCRRLRQVGRLKLAPATVSTSARRFDQLGVWRTYWRMNCVTVGYWLGWSPERLRKIYEGH